MLPYALQSLVQPRTEFFMGDMFELLEACDGETEIRWNELDKEERGHYERWERGGFIRPARTGEQLLPQQRYRFYPSRFKEAVQWSITGRCNYRCKHCFMSAPHAAQGEPSWDQVMYMLDAFERCGIRAVGLTGGEPMVRADFWDLVDEIQRRGIVISTLYSNGLLVTDEFLDGLEARGVFPSIQFSFDGVGYHDWLRGVTGAEKTAVDAMRRCAARGVPVGASMVLFKDNRDSIRDSVNLLAKLGCRYIKIGNASPQGEWLAHPEHYLSQAEAYQTYLDYIPVFFEDGKPITLGLEGFYNYDRDRDEDAAFMEKRSKESDFGKMLMCGHVRRDMYVSPKGNVLPCMSMVGGPMEELFPNMLETPLEEILDSESPYMDIVDLRVSDYMAHNKECAVCKWRTECCGGCRALAVRDGTSNYLSKDPVVCQYYMDGWKEKKDELLERLVHVE